MKSNMMLFWALGKKEEDDKTLSGSITNTHFGGSQRAFQKNQKRKKKKEREREKKKILCR
jgi:hypothetical protein